MTDRNCMPLDEIYQCDTCQMVFMLVADLTKHLKIHSESVQTWGREFVCRLCSKQNYSTKAALLQHYQHGHAVEFDSFEDIAKRLGSAKFSATITTSTINAKDQSGSSNSELEQQDQEPAVSPSQNDSAVQPELPTTSNKRPRIDALETQPTPRETSSTKSTTPQTTESRKKQQTIKQYAEVGTILSFDCVKTIFFRTSAKASPTAGTMKYQKDSPSISTNRTVQQNVKSLSIYTLSTAFIKCSRLQTTKVTSKHNRKR